MAKTYKRTRLARFNPRRWMPRNLFARALLILVLPTIISQLFIAHIFYNRHWASVTRNLSNSVVGDVAFLYQTYHETMEVQGKATAIEKTRALGTQLNVEVQVNKRSQAVVPGRGKRDFNELYKGLSRRIKVPIAIENDTANNQIIIRVDGHGARFDFVVNRKALISPTTTIFMLWMAGTSLLLTFIAILFLRNQVKPIVTLARAAERLGLGQDVADFKPRGASEVRRAGRAFLVMSERIRRHVQSRTEMLAGISHDLRTPLTRMKLELELATMDAVSRAALSADIDEMGKMIDEYLDFARGDAGEIPEPMDVNVLLKDIVADYRRGKRHVSFSSTAPVMLMLRPQAMRRALTNLIDNALRYGGGMADITLEQSATFVRIKITDTGTGIPETEHESVFKPFTRLEPSRNNQTGGVGLGLSIARAVAQTHGGDVTLENQRDSTGRITGLEVTMRLPREVQPTE